MKLRMKTLRYNSMASENGAVSVVSIPVAWVTMCIMPVWPYKEVHSWHGTGKDKNHCVYTTAAVRCLSSLRSSYAVSPNKEEKAQYRLRWSSDNWMEIFHQTIINRRQYIELYCCWNISAHKRINYGFFYSCWGLRTNEDRTFDFTWMCGNWTLFFLQIYYRLRTRGPLVVPVVCYAQIWKCRHNTG